MVNINPFKKKNLAAQPVPAQTAQQIKDEVGFVDEEYDNNLGETPAPFLPNEAVPRRMPNEAPQQQDYQEDIPPVPDFLNPQAQQYQAPAAGVGIQPSDVEPQAIQPVPFQQPMQPPQPAQQQYAQPPQPDILETELEAYEQKVEGQAKPEAHSAQAADVHNITTAAVEGLRRELQSKIDSLNVEITSLRKLEESVMQMTETLSKVEQKYEKMSATAGQLPEKTETEIQDIKSTVDSMSAMFSKALPALIKEIRSLKEPSLR